MRYEEHSSARHEPSAGLPFLSVVARIVGMEVRLPKQLLAWAMVECTELPAHKNKSLKR
jgi:hypothetical protein